MALKPWEVLLIVIGGLIGIIGLYFIYNKVDSGLPRPERSVGIGENGENSGFWPLPERGGKRKRKLRRKPRR